MSEYIGSRISLISKSDIKYVGTLHEINSENSTIALENVTSYGTEGRRGDPSQEQPGSDQIYEYIVFRGSDVKELSMVEAPKENQPPAMPNDPAIMGSTRPPQQQAPNQQPPQFRNQPGPGQQQQPPYPPPYGFPQGPPPQFQQQARFQGPGGPHGFPGSPGAVPGYGGMGGFAPPPPGYGMPPPYGPPPPGQGFGGPPPPGAFSPNNPPMPIGPPGQQRPQMQGPGQGPMGNGSKQGTPQPTPAQAPQPPATQANAKPESTGTPASTSVTPATAPPPPVESKPTTAAATAPPQPPQQKPAKKPTDSRIALPLAAPKSAAPKQAPAPSQAAPAAVAQPSSYADATHAATAAVAAAMAKLAPGSQQPQVQQTGGSMDNLAQKVNQMRVQDAPARGRGRGRGRGGPAGVRRESTHKPVEVPTEDYDFESANAKFNKQDLVKQQIASGEPMPSQQQNGAVPEPASNGHTEIEDVVIPAKPGAEKGYDKQSSFFDNISSDLKDRQVQHGEMIDGRAMRRDERNKNVDTFGQGSVDNGYRGGFRGRGRGGRGFARGGPRGGGFAPRGRGRGGAGEPALV